MSWLLAIESSTSRASLALMCGGEPVFSAGFESDRNHNALLFAPLQEALARLGGEKLGGVVVGTGPGSYSGTRVGIAAGQGVALVHGCPAAGLSSLLAAGVTEGVAVGDARRGSAWWARIGAGLPQPALIDPGLLPDRLEGGGEIFSFEDSIPPAWTRGIPVRRLEPTALGLGRAWLGLPAEIRESLLATPPQPEYLRPPHITEAKMGHPLLRSQAAEPTP